MASAVTAGFVFTPAIAQDKPRDKALEQYYLANTAYNNNLYPIAAAQFDEFLRHHRDHPKADNARYGLAVSLYALKQYEKAMRPLSELLQKKDLARTFNREQLVMLQGQCMLHTGRKDEAKKLLVNAVEQFNDGPFKVAGMAAIADISFGKADWPDTVTWTERVVKAHRTATPNQLARALYQQGFAHYQTKKSTDAITSLARVAQLKSDAIWQTRTNYLLADCYTLTKQLEQAETAYVAALPGLNGNDADECRFRLGLARFELKKYAESSTAFEAYLKSAKEGPHRGESSLYIGRCYLEQSDFRKAERQLANLSNGKDAVAAKASLWLGRVYSRQKGNYDRAAQVLGQATEKFKKNSPVIDELDFDYANALMSKNSPDWKTAAAAFQRIERRRRFGQMAEVYSQWAVCMHKQKEFNTSLGLNDRFISSYKEHDLLGDNRFMRAENLYLMKRADDATKAYGDFITNHKTHKNQMAAAFRVAQIHHDKGEWEESLASAIPLLAKKPEGRLFAQLSFIVGDSFFRQDRWNEAVVPLEHFIATYVKIERKRRQVKNSPNVDTALMQLAVAYDHLDKKEQALDHLMTLTSYYPGETPQLPLALTEQGRIAYETGDLRLARQALERFTNEFRSNKPRFKKRNAAQVARVHYFLAWVNDAEKRHKEAADHFGQVIKLTGTGGELSSSAALQQGIAFVNMENFEISAKHFREMMNHYRNHEKMDRVIYYAGLSMARLEDWRNAANMFRQVIEKHAKSEFADQSLYEWAWCERNTKRKTEATKLYEQLLANYPESSLALKVQSELAELNLDKGAMDKVIAKLTETLKTATDEKLREEIRYQLASALYKKRDYESAAPMFEQLLTDYPKSKLRSSMFFQAGESRLALHETVKARDHFAAGVKLGNAPAHVAESLLMRLGETQSQTGEYKQAQQTYRTFLGRFRESQWTRSAQFGMAFAMEMEGKKKNKQAIGEYSKLLQGDKIDLWTVRARYQTGECYFNEQKYEEAKIHFLHVEVHYKKYPGWQAKAVFEMARVLYAEGKKDDAIDRFKDVIHRYPKEKAAIAARQYLDKLRSQR